jgi:vacuolar protein sorting-associated protein 13B
MLTTAASLSRRRVCSVAATPQVESPAASRVWAVVSPVTASLASPRVCIDMLTLSPLQLTVTVHATRPVYLGVNDMLVTFSAVNVSHVACPAPKLARELLASFIADALLSSPALVGSLELLGNPTGLLRSMSRGVYSLFALPIERARSDGTTGGVLAGLAQGWSALVTHVSHGTLVSLSGLAGSLSRNLDRLSLDDEHVRRREVARRDASNAGVASGLASGMRGLTSGLWSAASGLVSAPLHAASQGGWRLGSIAQGVSKGLLGAITKPIGGQWPHRRRQCRCRHRHRLCVIARALMPTTAPLPPRSSSSGGSDSRADSVHAA